MYTAFHDRRRCFPETVGGTFSVTVAGSWFPRTLAGRLHAFCAYVRCTLAAIWLAWTACRYVTPCCVHRDSQSRGPYGGIRRLTASRSCERRSKQPYDAVFVDQVSAVIPALKLLTSAKAGSQMAIDSSHIYEMFSEPPVMQLCSGAILLPLSGFPPGKQAGPPACSLSCAFELV